MAILTIAQCDASCIAADSVRFGGTKAVHSAFEDLDEDDDLD
jgi:hypothetical protein